MKTQITLWEAFLWLSNTDPHIYEKARTTSKWNRVGLSLFVLITGIFAFISSSYFVRTLFATYNETTKSIDVSTVGWLVSVIVGAIWMAFIINLDRMIIASSSRWTAVLRIPLAIAIGLVVAIPFEVQLFSGRINKALTEKSRLENQKYEQKYNNAVTNTQDEIKQLKATISQEKSELANWKNVMEAEAVGRVKAGLTGKAGRGPAYEEAKENYDLHKGFLEQAEAQFLATQQNSGNIKNEALSEFKQQKIEQCYDFASQYEQFCILKEDPKNKGLKHLAMGINWLFILIELIPALMKLMSNNDVYDQLLKSRTHLDEQAVNVLTNVYMEEILNRKSSILNKQDEKYQPRNSFTQIGNTLK